MSSRPVTFERRQWPSQFAVRDGKTGVPLATTIAGSSRKTAPSASIPARNQATLHLTGVPAVQRYAGSQSRASTSTPATCPWWPGLRGHRSRANGEAPQTVLRPGRMHVPAVCDVGNGACRPDPGSHKIPVARARSPSTRPSATTSRAARRRRERTEENAGGHSMGGAQISSAQVAGGAASTVDVFVQPLPLPTAKISVFVFQDDNPLNGENDAGGGVDRRSRPTSRASAASTSCCSTRRASSATRPARSPTTCSACPSPTRWRARSIRHRARCLPDLARRRPTG